MAIFNSYVKLPEGIDFHFQQIAIENLENQNNQTFPSSCKAIFLDKAWLSMAFSTCFAGYPSGAMTNVWVQPGSWSKNNLARGNSSELFIKFHQQNQYIYQYPFRIGRKLSFWTGWLFLCNLVLKLLYSLVIFHVAIENGPFIDDLAVINGGSFHSYVNGYQRVSTLNPHYIPLISYKITIKSPLVSCSLSGFSWHFCFSHGTHETHRGRKFCKFAHGMEELQRAPDLRLPPTLVLWTKFSLVDTGNGMIYPLV